MTENKSKYYTQVELQLPARNIVPDYQKIIKTEADLARIVCLKVSERQDALSDVL
jgi:hypothetical protein